MKIVTVEEMRALEAAAFATGVSEADLQQRAGHAVAEEVATRVQAGQRVCILVGHGNNGRDGAVAALWLLRRGTPVDLVLAPRHAITAEELTSLRANGASITACEDQSAVGSALTRASVAVDALAGIGARGALREPLASLARLLNQARNGALQEISTSGRGGGTRLHVLALDLPSGVDGDSGAVPGEAVWADSTVTLGAVKQGLLRFPAAERVGHLVPRDIGLPPEAENKLPYGVIAKDELQTLVPRRPLDAHKYRFGRTLVIAGSDHFLGAPVLCAGAAARVGAGLVTVASTRDVRLNVAAHLPEVTFTQDDVRADAGTDAVRLLEAYLRSHNSIVIGPGLGRGDAQTAFVEACLRMRPREQRLVIDADGLFALSEIANWQSLLDDNTILTPHSGELERLVGAELEEDQPLWVHARRLAQRWQCVLVAKGPFTCVAAPGGQVAVWPHANAALATGGTGDVLAGVIAGLLAQGLAPFDAARLGVGVHALSAARRISSRAWRTLLASDLLDELPATLQVLATQPR